MDLLELFNFFLEIMVDISDKITSMVATFPNQNKHCNCKQMLKSL